MPLPGCHPQVQPPAPPRSGGTDSPRRGHAMGPSPCHEPAWSQRGWTGRDRQIPLRPGPRSAAKRRGCHLQEHGSQRDVLWASQELGDGCRYQGPAQVPKPTAMGEGRGAGERPLALSFPKASGPAGAAGPRRGDGARSPPRADPSPVPVGPKAWNAAPQKHPPDQPHAPKSWPTPPAASAPTQAPGSIAPSGSCT